MYVILHSYNFIYRKAWSYVLIQQFSLSLFKDRVSCFVEKVIFWEIPLQEGLIHPGKMFFFYRWSCRRERLAGQTLFQPLSWGAPCRKELMVKTGRSLWSKLKVNIVLKLKNSLLDMSNSCVLNFNFNSFLLKYLGVVLRMKESLDLENFDLLLGKRFEA